jgi:flagellar biosynthetic protein FliR
MIITIPQLGVFLLIIDRIAGLVIEAPIFSTRLIPAMVKVCLAIWISIVLWFVVPLKAVLPADAGAFVLAMLIEFMIGFTIGFVCNMIFSAVQAAGDIIDMQMGMSIATVISPTTGGVVSIIGMISFFFAMVIFLVANGHHLILSSLVQSFRVLPIGMPIDPGNGKMMIFLMELLKSFWLIAIQLSAPIVLLIFIADFTFGIVSRVAPQVNVFMLGFQVKPSLGLAGIAMTLPLLARHVTGLIAKMGEELIKLFAILRPIP